MAITAFVDLSSGEIRYEPTDPLMKERYLGGRGFGAKLLFDLVGPAVEPFDPENYLIFTAGPLSGTSWPLASRYHVTFKSPETNAYGYANSGGHFGPEMARAGFDIIAVTGRAAEPVYLYAQEGKLEIRSAKAFWGQTTSQVQETMLGADAKNNKSGRILCIGPAGENRVRLAAIMNDFSRAAARGGPGAVMGSKNLKAIHVKGDRNIKTTPPFSIELRNTSKHLITDPKNRFLKSEGTIFLLRPKNMTGDLPAKNHQLAQVPFIDDMDSDAINRYVVERPGCEMCVIKCSRVSLVKDGPYAAEVEGPEYETTDALGPMCWNGNPEVIIKSNLLCNEFGLDTISTGVTIAFAMECHQNGLLNDPVLSLEWGDPQTILGLIEKIAHRDGIGDLLADGVKRAAEKIGNGAEYYAMHVKGVELPRQEPRFSKGFGLGHATSNRGADHLYGLPAIDLAGNWETARKIFPAEIVDKLMDPEDESYKPDMLIYGEHYCAVTDALGVCKFSTAQDYSLLPEDFIPGLVALGIDLTTEKLIEIGERIVNLERIYNVREEFDRSDDQLPRRFTEESVELRAHQKDPVTGRTVLGEIIQIGRLVDFNAMLDRYYDLRGWNRDGHPKHETLERLKLLDEAQAVSQI
ncbi:MAG: aldehyde ferredoxin oxidoreductase family protein [Chloroflexi bacterium]|nr:aldehyde ferredoxin oxidoreductase family protein [Chloroflexota bacterium]